MTSPKFPGLAGLFGVFGLKPGENHESRAPISWRPVFWAYAAIVPAALYSFDAIKISLYHVARAANVNLLTQLAVMFVFYGLWIFAPRLCWSVAAHVTSGTRPKWESTIIRLSLLGLFLASAHLFLLTILLLAMHATASWAWEPIHILHAFGEVWLGYAGLWLILYAAASAIVLYGLIGRRRSEAPLTRYEVRESGKTLSIPIVDIYWVKAAGNYVELHTARGVVMVRKTLSQIDKEIGACGFLKSHRSALINGGHVLAINSGNNATGFTVQLSNQEEAPLSRRRLSTFKELLKSVN